MSWRDDWPVMMMVGVLFAGIAALSLSGYIAARTEKQFAIACYQAGGTPIHANSGSFCVAEFADMHKARP